MPLKSKVIIFISLILIALVIILCPYYIFVTKTLQVSPFKTLFSRSGLKTYNNHVNILFLGITGNGREGPNLSDSIIVFSYDLKTNQMTTISIPRDVWSEALRDKINSAYAYGEAKKKGSGFILAKAEVETIVGQPIHYATAVDFSQFEELIDFLGGIEVNVEKTFDDYAFPIPDDSLKEPPACGHSEEDIQKFTESYPSEEEIWKYFPCRYKHIRFDEGITLMGGETALNFARSRHSIGSEGTDFAREKRQQKIIEGIKNRLIAFAKKPNISQYQLLYDLTNKLVKRDINNQQLAVIFKNIVFRKNFTQDKILLSEDFFINPETNLSRFDGLWVLIPVDDDIKIVHRYIDCRLSQKTNCEELKPKRKEDR
ncbi:Cell envelope-related transcriptional attenuator [Candidatus Roizmanbacteria bacterium]|nr:Cell envelope-related transcriptional attenuator [Candidatus Roizmanbacteria bacterium]